MRRIELTVLLMKQSKNPLPNEERRVLKSLHRVQIALEVTLTVFLVGILTINAASISVQYGVVETIILLVSAFALLLLGGVLSFGISQMRKFSRPIASRSTMLRRWVVVTWLAPVVVIALIVLLASLQHVVAGLVVAAIGAVLQIVAIITTLVLNHRLWLRFNKKRHAPIRIISYCSVGVLLLLVGLFGVYTTTEGLIYRSVETTDANLELGQQEIRQTGKNGQKKERHNLLFGFVIDTEQTDSVDEIVAKGSRRYQYMYCSDGSYRYYTAEQFKDPSVGFTHQSEDNCAKNGNGTQTTIADVPPPEKIVQQVPTYYPSYSAPSYRAPSSYTTTCNTYSFSSSITCRTY